ncbi:MAG: hypothetical protein ACXWDL_06585 [Nocardioides sp.]
MAAVVAVLSIQHTGPAVWGAGEAFLAVYTSRLWASQPQVGQRVSRQAAGFVIGSNGSRPPTGQGHASQLRGKYIAVDATAS